jgi:hypothetical protein
VPSGDQFSATIHKIEFTNAEILKLPEPVRSFIVASSTAMNQLNFFLGIMAQAWQGEAEDNDIANEYLIIYRFIALRHTAATCYESLALFEEFSKKISRKSNPDLIKISTLIDKCIAELKSDDAFHFVEDTRDHLTSHFAMHGLNFNSLNDLQQTHNVYLHSMNGNSLAPLSESIFFFLR